MPRSFWINCDNRIFVEDVTIDDPDNPGDRILTTTGEVAYTIESKYLVDGTTEEIDDGDLDYVEAGKFDKVIDAAISATMTKGRRYYITYTYTDDAGNKMTLRDEVYGDWYEGGVV